MVNAQRRLHIRDHLSNYINQSHYSLPRPSSTNYGHCCRKLCKATTIVHYQDQAWQEASQHWLQSFFLDLPAVFRTLSKQSSWHRGWSGTIWYPLISTRRLPIPTHCSSLGVAQDLWVGWVECWVHALDYCQVPDLIKWWSVHASRPVLWSQSKTRAQVPYMWEILWMW